MTILRRDGKSSTDDAYGMERPLEVHEGTLLTKKWKPRRKSTTSTPQHWDTQKIGLIWNVWHKPSRVMLSWINLKTSYWTFVSCLKWKMELGWILGLKIAKPRTIQFLSRTTFGYIVLSTIRFTWWPWQINSFDLRSVMTKHEIHTIAFHTKRTRLPLNTARSEKIGRTKNFPHYLARVRFQEAAPSIDLPLINLEVVQINNLVNSILEKSDLRRLVHSWIVVEGPCRTKTRSTNGVFSRFLRPIVSDCDRGCKLPGRTPVRNGGLRNSTWVLVLCGDYTAN